MGSRPSDRGSWRDDGARQAAPCPDVAEGGRDVPDREDARRRESRNFAEAIDRHDRALLRSKTRPRFRMRSTTGCSPNSRELEEEHPDLVTDGLAHAAGRGRPGLGAWRGAARYADAQPASGARERRDRGLSRPACRRDGPKGSRGRGRAEIRRIVGGGRLRGWPVRARLDPGRRRDGRGHQPHDAHHSGAAAASGALR